MPKYKIVSTRQTDSVLKMEYEFRAKQFNNNCIDDQHEGVWSAVVSGDIGRFSLLMSEQDLEAYTNKLSSLNGKDYTQGDLFGESNLALIKTHMQTRNLLKTGSNPNSTPYSTEFGYLRGDQCIGGVTVFIDPLTSNIFLAVISYPQTATSYNDAEVTYILPEDLAEDVLQECIKGEAVDENLMLIQLNKKLNNEKVYALIEPLINQKQILLSTGQTGGNANLFKECSHVIEVEATRSNEQKDTKKVMFRIVDHEKAIEKVKKQKEILDQQSKQYPQLEQYNKQIMAELETLTTNISKSNKIKKSGGQTELLEQTDIVKNNITIYLQNPTQNNPESMKINITKLIKSLDRVDPTLAKQGNTLMNLIDAFISFFSKLFGRSQLENAKKTIKSIKEEVEKIEQPPLKEEVEEIKQPTLNK